MANDRMAELESLKALLDHAELTNDKLIEVVMTQREHGGALQQIVKALQPKEADGEESQLETLLKELVRLGHENADALGRIEVALAKR